MAKAVKEPVDTSALRAPPEKKGDVLESLARQLPQEPAPLPAGSRMALIVKGRVFSPPRILIYGIDGIGKSSFAAQAPKPIFIQTEDGLNEIDCERFPLARDYAAVRDSLHSLIAEKHDYETVVIDSLDWLERLIWDRVCQRTNVANIEKAGGGFAKGYTFALEEWREVLDMLGHLRARGMAVILTAHAKIERFEDPENPAYDRYSPRLNKHAEALVREWVDATLFATRRLVVRKEGDGFNERGVAAPVGADGGERILRTVGGPACVAKNRYDLPAEIAFPKASSWGVFMDHLSKSMKKGD